MPEQLSPFTVSAVVDTTNGAMVTPPYVRAGHVDYTAYATAIAQVTPLRPPHQFRWVHVWERTPAHAAGTDALAADLRPGQGRRPPVARAVTGPAGLKPYTISARVTWWTRQPVGEAVAMDGHRRPRIAGPWWTRQHTAHVWATDATAAVMQVFGTGRAPGRTAAGMPPPVRGSALETRQVGDTFEAAPADPAPGPPPSFHPRLTDWLPHPRHSTVSAAPPHQTAYAIAERQWHQQADRPAAERITAVTDAVWRHGYPPVYRAAYIHAATTIAAAATTAARTNPAARMALHHLAAAAGTAIRQVTPNQPTAPPADQAILDAAVHAAGATWDPCPPWQRVADATQATIKRAALHAGAAAATADTLTGWRNRNGDALAEHVGINGQPATAWVANLIAAVGGHSSDPRSRGTHADTGGTAAQLARQDQAPGVPTAQPPAPRTRPRPSGQPPEPTTGVRRGR